MTDTATVQTQLQRTHITRTQSYKSHPQYSHTDTVQTALAHSYRNSTVI